MSNDLNIPETDGEYGVEYTPEDKDSDGVPDVIRKANSVPNESFEIYQKVFDKDTTFLERFGHFLRAENKAGRKAKVIKDAALIFLPYGKKIENATEFITHIIEEEDTMTEDNNKIDEKIPEEVSKVRRFLKQKSTRAAMSILAGGLAYFGVEINPELLGEGLSAIVQGIGLFIAGGSTVYEMVRDEDKDKESK